MKSNLTPVLFGSVINLPQEKVGRPINNMKRCYQCEPFADSNYNDTVYDREDFGKVIKADHFGNLDYNMNDVASFDSQNTWTKIESLNGYDGNLGLSLWDAIKNPSSAIEQWGASIEGDVKDWAQESLPPEVYGQASDWIDKNGDRIAGKSMDQIQAMIQAEVLDKVITPESEGAAITKGLEMAITNFATAGGNIWTDFSRGGWGLVTKNHPTFVKGTYGVSGLMALAWALKQIGKGRKQRA